MTHDACLVTTSTPPPSTGTITSSLSRAPKGSSCFSLCLIEYRLLLLIADNSSNLPSDIPGEVYKGEGFPNIVITMFTFASALGLQFFPYFENQIN